MNNIWAEINGEIANIILQGKIDHSMQEKFRQVNDEVLDAKGAKEILVDFTKATFMDSSGIRALLILQKDAKSLSRKVILQNCNKNILNSFEVGGFDKIFTIR